MAKKFLVFAVLVLVLGIFAFVSAIAQDNAGEKMIEKSVCLACHGTFDDIAAATADYKAPSGETVTPHRYIPHTENQEIPECVECHKPHPIPPESKDQVVKPDNIDYCYSCHHMRNFQPCTACHGG